MLVVCSDTHAREGHRLSPHLLEAVHDADQVLHCGDLVTAAVLDAFEAETDAFAAVAGNNDTPAVRERIPRTRVVEWEGVRLAMAHGHEHTRTSLALFGRQSNADLVLVGHSHRPAFERLGEVPVLNPGSHADPRWHRPGYAALRREDGALVGELREPDGTHIESVSVPLA
jgi:putative phosphoesterase